MEFHEKLDALTSEQSRSAIALKAELPRNTVTNIITKQYTPRIDTALKLARTLGVDYEWLCDPDLDINAPVLGGLDRYQKIYLPTSERLPSAKDARWQYALFQASLRLTSILLSSKARQRETNFSARLFAEKLLLEALQATLSQNFNKYLEEHKYLFDGLRQLENQWKYRNSNNEVWVKNRYGYNYQPEIVKKTLDEIDELTSTIEEKNFEIQELNDKNEELQEEIVTLRGRLNDLEAKDKD